MQIKRMRQTKACKEYINNQQQQKLSIKVTATVGLLIHGMLIQTTKQKQHHLKLIQAHVHMPTQLTACNDAVTLYCMLMLKLYFRNMCTPDTWWPIVEYLIQKPIQVWPPHWNTRWNFDLISLSMVNKFMHDMCTNDKIWRPICEAVQLTFKKNIAESYYKFFFRVGEGCALSWRLTISYVINVADNPELIQNKLIRAQKEDPQLTKWACYDDDCTRKKTYAFLSAVAMHIQHIHRRPLRFVLSMPHDYKCIPNITLIASG